MNNDGDGFRRPPLQAVKGRRTKKDGPLISLVPSSSSTTTTPVEDESSSTIPSSPFPYIPPPPFLRKLAKRPTSPRDDTPIVINGEIIQSSPSPFISNTTPITEEVNPQPLPYSPPSQVPAPLLPAPPEVIINDTDNESDNESDDEDIIIPQLSSPPTIEPIVAVQEPPKSFISSLAKKIPSKEEESPVKTHIPSLSTKKDITWSTPVPVSYTPQPPQQEWNPQPQQTIRSQTNPYIAPPRTQPMPKKTTINTTNGIPIPKTITSESSYKTCRPTDIPEFEFFTEEAALAQLNEKDYYESTSYWRAKCKRLYARTPRLEPPTISDNEPPKLAKFKYDEYYKKCSAVHSAVQVGTIVYLGIAGLEFFLCWLGVKAQGLFSLTYSNREEYYDAMLEMGEMTLGWFKGTVSPVYRMAITFGISVVVLLCTNYAMAFLPKGISGFADKYKDGALKWLQDIASTFIGTKKIDPESTNNYGDTLFNLITPFLTGGSVPSMNQPPSTPTKPKQMYDE